MQKHIAIKGHDFYVCMEAHDHGFYIAIPNWNVCVEASEPEDWFYNAEQLRNTRALPAGSSAVADCAEEIAKAIAQEPHTTKKMRRLIYEI